MRISRGHRNHLKIERQSEGKATIIRLIGRIRVEHFPEIKKLMAISPEPIVFDLSEMTIVDADVIRFLSTCEVDGTQLASCPPYVREWILRERTEGGSI